MKTRIPLVVAMLLPSFAGAAAQEPPPAGDRSRFRVRLGVADAEGNALALAGSDNDLPTLCDRNLNPDRHFTPRGNPGCQAGPSEWDSSFAEAPGIGVELGAAVRVVAGLHFEFEAFRTHWSYDQTDGVFAESTSTADKLAQELVRAEVRIGEVRTTNAFWNLAWYLPVRDRFELHAGAGLGTASVALDYGSDWARNLDPSRIATLDDENSVFDAPGGVDREAERAALRRLIAGATTTADATLEDRLAARQWFVGGAVRLADSTSFELRLRWVGYGAFSGGGPWDQLRSHASDHALLPGDPGTDPVVYTETTEDLGGISLGFALAIRF